MNLDQQSKAISYFLRHDKTVWRTKQGYMFTDQLISKMREKFPSFDMETLKQIVAEDEKQRYSFADGDLLIRANQGHSVPVDLGLKSVIPPVTLYHGTNLKGFEGMQKTGIQKMQRHHVHLTDDINTAASVGMRKGSEVIVEVNTKEMVKDGVPFYQSDNGVWLVDFVDPKYISRKQ